MARPRRIVVRSSSRTDVAGSLWFAHFGRGARCPDTIGELLRQTRPEPPAGRASAKPSDFSGDGFDHEEPHGFAGGELAACKRRRAHDARRCRGRPTLLAVGMMLVASHFAD